jgi:cytochrome c biogenesis protein CcmG/thiol:disulfide interchange protein DsbE
VSHSTGGHRRIKPSLRWLWRGFAVIVPVAFVALLIYGVTAQSPSSTIDDSLSRDRSPPAPAFRLAVLQAGSLGQVLAPKLAGTTAQRSLGLADLRGKPVVLNFWASWCTPCQEEAYTLEQAWRGLGHPGSVLFLGLDMQDVTTDARTFLRHYSIDYPNVRDPSDEVARSYAATGVPETFFISAKGRIVGHIIGASSTAQLAAGIAAARSGQVQGADQGGNQLPLQ